MMKYEIWVKPFDVLIKNSMANMTSVNCATHLVEECQVKRGNGRPSTGKVPSAEEKLPSRKTVH